MNMKHEWYLRWDTIREEKPALIYPSEASSFSLAYLGPNNEGFAILDGYLFDKSEFVDDPHSTYAECVAAAYAKFVKSMFDHLKGGYILAIWDQRRRSLIAGRDGMGVKPFFYCWDGGLFLMSSSLDVLLAQPEVGGRFNRVVIAEYLQSYWPLHQRSETFYEQVNRLPAAHQLSLHNRKLSISRYWDPVPPGFQWASKEELDTFQPKLENAVRRCLSAGADSIALSGGFDSVSIALLASEILLDERPLHAVSLLFGGGPCDEGETQLAVAEALNMPQTYQTVQNSLENHTLMEGSLALSKISPCPVLSIWQAMYSGLLNLASKEGLSNLLMGTGGDEMLTVDLSYGYDLFSRLDLPGLWRFYQAMARTSPFSSAYVARIVLWQHAFKPVFRRKLGSALEGVSPGAKNQINRIRNPIKPWISRNNPELIETLTYRRENPIQIKTAPGEGNYVRTIRILPQSPLLMTELEQGGIWAKEAGFTLLYPFFDRDVVDLTLRVHPDELIANGYAKSPLRNLVTDRLRSVSLPAKKVDFTQSADQLLRGDGYSAWKSLNGLTMLEELGIINGEICNSLVESYFSGKSNWLITWLAISTEIWLRARSSESR